LVDIQRLDDPQLTKLDQQLRSMSCHILHFIGHGFFDDQVNAGQLYFQDPVGRAQPVSGEQLGTVLRDHKSIRLVVLNACEGARSSLTDPFAGIAQALIRRGVPAVIAMQFEVTDTAAITFASEFYALIAVGDPIDACVAGARKAIYLSMNEVEWATPVLYIRSTDSRVFLVEQTVTVVDQRALHLTETSERDPSVQQSQQLKLQRSAQIASTAGSSWMGRSLFVMLFTSHARIGFADAWTAAAIHFRNFLLNWRVNVPVLCLALLFLRFVAAASVGLARGQVYWLVILIGLFGAVCLIIAQALTTVYRLPRPEPLPTNSTPNGETGPWFNKIDPRTFLKNDLVWSVLSAVALTIFFCSWLGTAWVEDNGRAVVLLTLAIVGAFLFSAGWSAGWPVRRSLRDLALRIASGLVYGALVGLGAYLFALLQPYAERTDFKLSLPIIFGIPWFLTAQFAPEMIFGNYESDSDRPAVVAIGWTVTGFLSIGVGNLVYQNSFHDDLGRYVIALVVMSGIATALLGKSSLTSAIRDNDGSPMRLILDPAQTVAGAVFVGSLIVVVSVSLDLLMFGDTLLHALRSVSPSPASIALQSAVGGAVAALIAVIARKTRPRLT
jgi:CHAT domain